MKTKFRFLLFFLFSGISFNCVYADAQDYLIIVDAGSTSSKLHLFNYNSNTAVPEITEVFSEKVSPGLSSYAEDPQNAGASLAKLLDDVNTQLANRHVDANKVTVNVMATAGMRLLPINQQQAIYANVSDYIHTHSPFLLGTIGTITGKMEGLYGWLDVNYLNHTFQNHTTPEGSIDMGGASTQIAFIPEHPTEVSNLIHLTINGQSYPVFSISFLGLGQDEARLQMNQDPEASACYPQNYSFAPSSLGNYSFDQCTHAYANVIAEDHVKQSIPTIAPEQHFVAYSSIYRAYSFFNVLQSPDKVNVDHQIKEVCAETWEQMQVNYPNEAPVYLANYCANGTYISNLLYKNYGLHGVQLKVVDQINNQSIDWTLGAALYQLLPQ